MKRFYPALSAPVFPAGFLLCTGLATLLLPSAVAAQDPGKPTFTIFEAVRMGVARHPRTATARAKEDVAVAERRRATAARWPGLSFEGTGTGFQEPMIVAPLHVFDPTQPPVFARTLFQSRWFAGYTLFDGGERAANIDRATAASLRANSSTAAAEMQVMQSVATAYINVTTATRILEAENLRHSSIQRERGRVAQFFEAGRTAEVEVLRADAALALARASQVVAQQDLEATWRELCRLVDVPPDSLVPAQLQSVVALPDLEFQVDDLVSRALSANPGLAATGHEVDAAEAAARGARSAWLPHVQVMAGVVTFAGSGASLTGEWQGGLSVSYPIFTGGLRSARIAGANASAEAAAAAHREHALEIALGIDRLVAHLRASRTRSEALTRAVEYAAEVARIEQLALTAGAGVQTDFLEAEAELFSARANLERARHAELSSLIALAQVTGDLSLEWLQENVEAGQ
jgi:outer membrane protein